jgi:hypothetical protein
MEGQKMQARKTEYKGTVYRSKSEAMFAASLDFLGRKWVYEPRFYSVTSCGLEWLPDFAVLVHNRNEFCWDIVEFKPSQVSSVYLSELSDKAIELFAQKGPPIEVHLVTFNWFDPKLCDCVYGIDAGGVIRNKATNFECRFITPQSYIYAKNYRYDLEEKDEPRQSELSLTEMTTISELQLLIESKRRQNQC